MVAKDAFIAVYIMTNRPRGTLYIGVTSQLLGRISQHREEQLRGFTKRYHLHRLVWFEPHDWMEGAIQREKSLKRWPRQWKINLIERENPHWEDLWPSLIDWTPGPPQV